MRPTLVVANVLISGQGELLMGLRADSVLWEVPGGKVENEGVIDAAKRELLEETGIMGKGFPCFLGYVEAVLPEKGRFVVLFFKWSEWEGFAQLTEEKCLKWRWVPLDDLPDPAACTVGTRNFMQAILPYILPSNNEAEQERPSDEVGSGVPEEAG